MRQPTESPPGTPTTTPPPMPPDGMPATGDIVGITILALFFALLMALGIAFVRKKRKEGIEELARELEKPLTEEERKALPPTEEEPLTKEEIAGRKPPREVVPSRREAEAAQTRQAYSRGLEKTRTSFFGKLGELLSGKGELDAKIVDQLEPLLIQADVGVKTTDKLLAIVRERLSKADMKSADKVREGLREEILRMVDVPRTDIEDNPARPCVVMIVGVNGAGKTTTIGKLAHRLRAGGAKVVLGAGDTFRAAAVEQLKIWGDRAGCAVVEGKEGQDPASVIFETVKQAKEQNADYVLADTAGRLHTKVNLMEELKKVRRVISKGVEGAPHEVLLVLDATNGQNALVQAEQFNQAMTVTGIALTKLDGTAKGGIIIAICDQLKIPIHYVGVGEKLEDLQPFDAKAFVDSLFE